MDFQPVGKPDFDYCLSGLKSAKNPSFLDMARVVSAGVQKPTLTCSGNLTIGLFFDGTNNNKYRDWGEDDYKPTVPFEKRQHSNVARLFMAYPDERDKFRKGKGYSDKYYKYYIQGVGTKFKEIGDTGEGLESVAGGGAGKGGEMRLLWGMTQVINAIHRFYKDRLLVEDIAAKAAIKTIHIGEKTWRMAKKLALETALCAFKATPIKAARSAVRVVEYSVRELIKTDTEARNKQFKEWLDILKRFQEAGVKPQLNSITIDVFGFSRGAAEARAFTNWMIEAFGLSTKFATTSVFFGEIPVHFRFMGIFDTVASVGIASLYSFSEGHMAWADSCLQISRKVKYCLHLVAGHEVRACFPLDSVRVEGNYPGNVEEIVYPGAHSDLGGGYALRSFGKNDLGENRADLQISRVPCFHMYLKARDKGVPFYSIQQLQELNPVLLESFLPSRETIERMKKYEDDAGISGPVEDVLRRHSGVYLGCRWLMGEGYLNSPDFVRLGVKAKDIVEIKRKREAKEKELEEVQKHIHDKEGQVERIHQYRKNMDYGYDDKRLYPLLAELKALDRQQAALLEQLGPRTDADVMWETQEALITIVALYCGEIAGLTYTPGALEKLQKLGKQGMTVYTLYTISELLLPDGRLLNLFSNYPGKREDLAANNNAGDGQHILLRYDIEKESGDFEEEIRKNNKNVDQVLELKYSASRAAVACLKLWREYLATRFIPEEHDAVSPEREPIWLLEALEDIEKRSPEFIKSTWDFFADQVHDSMAGFIKDKVNEYSWNRYGIAKFRRIYFGDRGDACLREKVHAENVQRKAGARQNKANNHAMLNEQQANEKVMQWQVGNTMGDLGNMRW